MLSDSGPLTIGQSFGRRYHIKRTLGLGGMGAVYQAWDTELSVDVAIKLIRPRDRRDSGRRRGRYSVASSASSCSPGS